MINSGKLNHKDLGQIDFYVRFFEDRIKIQGDNLTIGLVPYTEKSKAIVKYSILNEGKQIFASIYKLYMPDKLTLRKEIEKECELLYRETTFREP